MNHDLSSAFTTLMEAGLSHGYPMKRIAFAAVLFVLILGAGVAADAPVAGLDGTYKAVALTRDGKEQPADLVNSVAVKIIGEKLDMRSNRLRPDCTHCLVFRVVRSKNTAGPNAKAANYYKCFIHCGIAPDSSEFSKNQASLATHYTPEPTWPVAWSGVCRNREQHLIQPKSDSA